MRWLASPSLIRLSLASVLFNLTSSLFMQRHLFFGLAFLLIQTTAQGSMPTNSLSLPIGISTDTQNSNIPPCVLQCLTQAAQVAGCETYVRIDFWGLIVAWTVVVIEWARLVHVLVHRFSKRVEHVSSQTVRHWTKLPLLYFEKINVPLVHDWFFPLSPGFWCVLL